LKKNNYDASGSDTDEDEMPLNNEYGAEYEEEYLDDQDINGGDREILDDRILGIVNIFQ
jgi:hypothetical protein